MPTIDSQLAKTDFLTLLTTQLRFQDPSNPIDQESFVSQLSQFSMLEGIEKLNDSFGQMMKLQEIAQGVELVGKKVEYQDPSTQQMLKGTIESVSVTAGNLSASINGQSVSLSQIAKILA